MCFANHDMLKDLLNFHNVKILTETCTEEITADTIITAVGYRSDNSLYNEMKMTDRDISIRRCKKCS